MTLDLTDQEARVLEQMLRGYLPDLRREVARTESHELRHDLVVRQELCERLVDRLRDGVAAASRGSTT
jgi:hypothetical protein